MCRDDRRRSRRQAAALAFPLVDVGFVLPLLCDTLVLAIAQRSQRKRCPQSYTAGDGGKKRDSLIDLHRRPTAAMVSSLVRPPS